MSPKHVMVGVSGYSGSGKDEIARIIGKVCGGIKIGFADEAKRNMASVYEFSKNQLFGPSSARNLGDIRYPKPIFERMGGSIRGQSCTISYQCAMQTEEVKRYIYEKSSDFLRMDEHSLSVKNIDPFFFLSPRECLQKYCEYMNTMYSLTWVQRAYKNHILVGDPDTNFGYDLMEGVINDASKKPIPYEGTSFTSMADIRHWQEINFLRKKEEEGEAKVYLMRVKRPSVPNPPYDHRSETEQAQIPDNIFDYVINNDSTLEDLERKVEETISDMVSKNKSV